MKKTILSLALVSFACMLAAGTASAIPIPWAPNTLQVDFRDATLWNPTHVDGNIGFHDITSGDITVTAHPNNVNLSQYALDGFGVYGVNPGGYDEIDSLEWLQVDIGGGGMSLNGAWLSDFFQYNDDYNAAEWGTLWLNHNAANAQKIEFTANDGSYAGQAENVDNGEYFVAFNYDPLIFSIEFLPGYVDSSTNSDDAAKNDYSVIGLAANPVPEPASMLLLGTGLVGLVGMKKRFTKG